MKAPFKQVSQQIIIKIKYSIEILPILETISVTFYQLFPERKYRNVFKRM